MDKFKVTFADWWVLINTMPSVRTYQENYTAINAATDPHYLAYELSNSEDKVTWYQKGEEPYDLLQILYFLQLTTIYKEKNNSINMIIMDYRYIIG